MPDIGFLMIYAHCPASLIWYIYIYAQHMNPSHKLYITSLPHTTDICPPLNKCPMNPSHNGYINIYMPSIWTPPTTDICPALLHRYTSSSTLIYMPRPALALIYVMHILPPVPQGCPQTTTAKAKKFAEFRSGRTHCSEKSLAASMVQIHYRDLRIIGDDGTQHMRRSLGNMDLMMEIWKCRWSTKDDLGNISLDNNTTLLSPQPRQAARWTLFGSGFTDQGGMINPSLRNFGELGKITL